jgi:predicted RNA-binding Zn-ribbon protein involved in translation (DUF1610 family)
MPRSKLNLRFTLSLKDRRLELPAGRYVVGRSSSCSIRINEPQVSREHLVIRVEQDQATVEDLGSKNGTRVNGMAISARMALAHGDHVSLGTLELQVSIVPESDFIEEDTITLKGPEGVSLVGDDEIPSCPVCEAVLPGGEETVSCPFCGHELRRRAQSYTAELPLLDPD